MKFSNKRFNIAIVYYLMLIILIIVSGVYTTVHTQNSAKDNEIDAAKVRVQSLSYIIRNDHVDSIPLTEKDVATSSTYSRLKIDLANIKNYEFAIRKIYTLKKVDDKIFFVADSERNPLKDYNVLGKEYGETKLIKNVFDNGEIITEGPIEDESGTWFRAIAPIMDNKGNYTSAVGIDIDQQTNNDITNNAVLFIWLIVFSLLLVVFLLYKYEMNEVKMVNLKSDFLALASHEIRSPLTKIRWGLSVMINNSETQTSVKEELKKIQETTIRLISLTNSIIETTAADKNIIINKNTCGSDLKIILDNSIKNVKDKTQDKFITFNISKSFESGVCVQGETDKLELAFTNILSNAYKYSPDNSKIDIDLIDYGKKVDISVKDYGIGIPKDEVKNIFNGFYRAKNAQESNIQGSGFGLYMTKKIIEFCNGVLKCTSELNRGTTVTVTLLKGKA